MYTITLLIKTAREQQPKPERTQHHPELLIPHSRCYRGLTRGDRNGTGAFIMRFVTMWSLSCRSRPLRPRPLPDSSKRCRCAPVKPRTSVSRANTLSVQGNARRTRALVVLSLNHHIAQRNSHTHGRHTFLHTCTLHNHTPPQDDTSQRTGPCRPSHTHTP